jgi:hypothetical protein
MDFAAGDAPASVAIADLNGDGVRDLAVANSASDNVSVLLNLTNLSPVEGAFYAVLGADEEVVLRWTLPSLSGIYGLNVYRAVAAEGPFSRINDELLPPSSPGYYEDATVWPETTFRYELRALVADGHEETVGASAARVTTGGRLTAVLYPAVPNPFGHATAVQFDVPDEGEAVRLGVYNVRGQEVRCLVDGPMPRGRHSVVWDGRDESGAATSSGVYFVRLEAGREVRGQKLVVTR